MVVGTKNLEVVAKGTENLHLLFVIALAWAAWRTRRSSRCAEDAATGEK